MKIKKSIIVDTESGKETDVIEEIKETVLDGGEAIEVKGKTEEAKGLIFLLSGTSELSQAKYIPTKEGAIFQPTHRYQIWAKRAKFGK